MVENGIGDRPARGEGDLERVEATLRGDREAFEVLFVKYRDRVYQIAYGYTYDREEALDVAQEAFVKAYEKLASFKGRASFYTWLCQIAINLAIDRGRRKKNAPVALESYMSQGESEPGRAGGGSGEPDDPAKIAEEREMQEGFREALGQLSDDHRAVFLLSTVEELKYKEIAEVLQVPIGTVMSRLHYARKRLQELLKKHIA